jgi:hypothetical protein
VQEVLSRTREVEKKLRRNRPLNSLKDKRRKDSIGSLREASQVCEQVNESRGEILRHFVDCIRKKRRSKSSKEISQVPRTDRSC